ncbi:hypothetical protein LTR29_013216 [Friedmanniomyces endolithicus]|nr:hypothetical protein LTR94_023140 [Friedmanniomyces endolithicus]KAK0772450.1 hypothetical protein LTR75_017409 [Friedmanniomyces endolithicus]KAK0774008.1 hypothetical protein LTR38_016356 [Friedmanniomyces endolithicus]KAK0850839.1 hypothetical protein LTR03_004349 [Friedmanniomyces endolithicus]KAK0861368.1 hypothetical protein LTS02_007855 [Friedmanniomyces endolithicus]
MVFCYRSQVLLWLRVCDTIRQRHVVEHTHGADARIATGYVASSPDVRLLENTRDNVTFTVCMHMGSIDSSAAPLLTTQHPLRQLLHQNIITQMPVAMDNQLGQFEALMSAIAPMSPEYHRLRRVIKESEGFCAPEDPMFRQVWAADLTGAEIKSLFEVAHKQLERAIKAKVAALQMELDKLNQVLARGFHDVGQEDPEDLKSDVCLLVLQRWSHESAVEEMTGRK